jgi:hypothetical protein
MKVLWVSGWGIDLGFFHAYVEHIFPMFDHTVREPCPQNLPMSGFDWIIGYSLGCNVVLHRHSDCSPSAKLALVAPFLAFAKESGQGGKITSAEVKLTKRTLRLEPLLAIHSFYEKACLNHSITKLPYELNHLFWGLDILLTAKPKATSLAKADFLIIGDSDPLIESDKICQHFPKANLVLKGVGHDFQELLPKLPIFKRK